MAKPELGTKRQCPKCASRFYDLQRNPASCPICSHSFDPDAPVKKRGKRKSAKLAAEDTKGQVSAAQAVSKKRAVIDDEDDIELPEFDDLDIIEEIDDLDDIDDVEGIKGKPVNDGEDAEDIDFDADILEDDIDSEDELDIDGDDDIDSDDNR